jgi:arylsulfatase A-like enzyme
MRGPGIPAGIRVAAPVSSVDLAPTLLALGSLELPTAVDGLDLSRLWSDREPGPFASRYLYGEASGGLGRSQSLPGIYPLYRSVRQGRFKLVRRSLGSQIDYELFDLAQDPNEQRDIAHQEPDRFAALLSELERRQRSSPGSGPKGAEVELEASEIDQLRALGYAP